MSSSDSCKPVSEAGGPSAAAFALESDGPRIAGSRVRYPQPLSHYAEVYGKNERTIKRWVKRGMTVTPQPDLPPLHRPELMPDWCTRRLSKEIPESILLAASEATLPASTPVPSAVPTSAPPSQPAPPAGDARVPRNFDHVTALTLDQNVEALRIQVAISKQLLQEAQEAGDQGLVASRQRAYRETFTELRKAENDLVEHQRLSGDLAPLAEVRAENNRISSTIFNAVLRLVKNVRPQLTGKAPSEQDRIWKDETLACFGILKGARFTSYHPPVPDDLVSA